MVRKSLRTLVASALAGGLVAPALLAGPASAGIGGQLCLDLFDFQPVEAAGPGEVDPEEANYIYVNYGVFTHRTPSEHDFLYWTEQLETKGIAVVPNGIGNSLESAYTQVACTYQALLDRDADFAGAAYWAGQVDAGMTLEALTVFIMESPEFRPQFESNDEIVAFVYDFLLQRSPVQEEIDYWSGLLDAGTITPGGFAAAVFESAEFEAEQVQNMYAFLLGREPDPDGYAFWLARLDAVGTIQATIDMLGTLEAFNRFSNI